MMHAGPFVVASIAILAGTILSIVKMLVNRRSAVRPAELEAIEQRLTRIEQPVDAIAVETERISEGQRFTTRLLAERREASPVGR